MLSPRDQTVLEAEILSSASTSCPRPHPRASGLGMSSDFVTWPRACVFHDKAQANDLHSTIRPMPSQYEFTIYSHRTCLDDYWQRIFAEMIRL